MFTEALNLARLLAGEAPSAPTTDGSQTVTVALIGLAGLILSALIAGYFGTRGERADRVGRRAVPDLRRQLDEAVYDAAVAENERRDADENVTALRDRVEVLERALVLRGFAPWRFTTGEESDDHARIRPGR